MPAQLDTALAAATLSEAERRTVRRFVAMLDEALGDDLRAVWLYGSRARGERPHPESDVDLLVIAGGDGEAAGEFVAAIEELLNDEDIRSAHHLRVDSRHGVIDIMRGRLPPLVYETASARAIEATWRGQSFRVAALRSLVGFKCLAGRGQDRVDLEALENANDELPIDEIPLGLDT